MLQVEGISSHELNIQGRTRLLLGEDNLARLQKARVLIFGVGGVGSWCAEALVRSGVGCLTLVDADVVCATNCNRQLMATSLTLGQAKVEALRSRRLEINPKAKIEALQKIYNADSAASFKMEEYDFVIDAIDSLSQKADLILRATSLPKTVTFISSMGAALRTDPFKIRQAEFWDIKGDPLARAIRKKRRTPAADPRGMRRSCSVPAAFRIPARTIGRTPTPRQGSDKRLVMPYNCHIRDVDRRYGHQFDYRFRQAIQQMQPGRIAVYC